MLRRRNQPGQEAKPVTPQEPAVDGLIAYYGLTDWWLTSFTAQERDYIEARYDPMGSSGLVTLTSEPSVERVLLQVSGPNH